MREPKPDRMGEYTFRGWDIDFGKVRLCPDCGEEHEDGNSTQGEPDPRVVSQMERLRDAICPLGWDLTWDMLVTEATYERETAFMCMPAMAFIHIFLNGEMSYLSEKLPTGPGIRICGDELRVEEGECTGITAADCFEVLVRQLPEHVDLIIEHLQAYPNYKRSVQ